MLTAEVLRSLLRYEPDTGHFFRLCRHKKKDANAPAGATNNWGYVLISVLGKNYRAHRLAWLYVHGEWPMGDIDHINHDRADNRIENLRSCTRLENCRNKSVNKRKPSGIKGVGWSPKDKKYRSDIYVDNKRLFLGLFHSIDEAARAYNKAAIENFGEFACLNHVRAEQMTEREIAHQSTANNDGGALGDTGGDRG